MSESKTTWEERASKFGVDTVREIEKEFNPDFLDTISDEDLIDEKFGECTTYRACYLQGIEDFKKSLKKETEEQVEDCEMGKTTGAYFKQIIDTVNPLNHDTGGDNTKK